jgi:hypothetical protein
MERASRHADVEASRPYPVASFAGSLLGYAHNLYDARDDTMVSCTRLGAGSASGARGGRALLAAHHPGSGGWYVSTTWRRRIGHEPEVGRASFTCDSHVAAVFVHKHRCLGSLQCLTTGSEIAPVALPS